MIAFPSLRPRLAALCAGMALAAAAAAQPLVAAPPAAPPPLAAACADCHGPLGNPALPGVPLLAGQSARYIELQLRDFQQGRRWHEPMAPLVEPLTREQMRELGRWFAAQRPAAQRFRPDAARARLGRIQAEEALCTVCHLGGFLGQNEIPRVAGQPFDYVLKQLRDFKSRARSNDAGNMTAVMATLDDEALLNLAHHIAGL
jgi:cytochrome c553